MENTKNIPTNKNKAAAVEQPKQPNHTAVIKSQVLAKIGKPPPVSDTGAIIHSNPPLTKLGTSA